MTKPTLQAVDPNTVDPGTPTTPPDPFDLASLRLNPSFLETAGVKKLITTVPSHKPSPRTLSACTQTRVSRELRDNRAQGGSRRLHVQPEILPELSTRSFTKRSSPPSIGRA